jgi:DNA-binding transcriptional ArsR family regulator
VVLVDAEADSLSRTFGALADPTRRTIVARLAQGDAAVNELAALFPAISLQAVSKHLKVLEQAGVISRGRQSRQRPAHLESDAIDGASDWLAQYRRFFSESLDRLDEHLTQVRGADASNSSGRRRRRRD